MHIPEQTNLGMLARLHPPDKRRRDLDNMHATLKYYLDGVFKALGVDDSCLQRVTLQWDTVVDAGCVDLEIYNFAPSSG